MEYGTCPVCNGKGRVAAGDNKYKQYLAGYDEATDTLACNNCGGQRMYGRPSGKVPLRSDGTPCKHEYQSKTVGRSLTRYTCKQCGDSYEIDSGD